MSGFSISHLPMRIFCWFPPEKVATSPSGSGGRTRKCSMRRIARERSFLRRMTPARANRLRCGRVMLDEVRIVRTRPWRRRSSGDITMPRAAERRMDRLAYGSPFTRTSPPVAGSAPTMARAISLRPLPTSPVRPTISPLPTVRLAPLAPRRLTRSDPSRPRKTFSATVSSGTSWSSWSMIATPRDSAWRGSQSSARSPKTSKVPGLRCSSRRGPSRGSTCRPRSRR